MLNKSTLLVLLVVGNAVGCGGPRYHPVEGAVEVDGKPLADAAVMFHPVQGGAVAHAVTDSGGRYRLVSAGKAGVLAGEYLVTVVRQKFLGATVDAEGLESDVPSNYKVEWLTPPKYGKVETSGLKVAVPSTPDQYSFKLVSR